MNKKRLLEIADWLDAGAPEKNGVAGFDMTDFENIQECGTVCCIAGTARYWWGNRNVSGEKEGKLALDLTEGESEALFYGKNRTAAWKGAKTETYGLDLDDEYKYISLDLEAITPAIASKTIRHFVETGDVVWEGAS